MKSLRIWLAKLILGRHGRVDLDPRLRAVTINGTRYPVLQFDISDQTSTWTNSDQ